MWHDRRTVHTVITTIDGRSNNFPQQSMALPAITAAVAADPLFAAFETIRTAVNTYGFGRSDEFFSALRQTFSTLR